MSGVATASSPARYRDALRSREFRGLIVAQVLSEWGDHIARVAIAALVLARTDSAFLAVLAFVVSFLPAVVASALLGGLADRKPRKLVLLACDLARAVVIMLLALVAVDGTSIWVLLGLLLVAETFTAPFEAAQRAVVPDVLPDPRHYLAGNGLMRVLNQLDQVIGICLAGVVIVLVGERKGLVFDAVSFLLSFLVIAVTLRPRPAPRGELDSRGSVLADFATGWRIVFEAPAIRALVLLGWGSAVFLIAPEAVALAYARGEGASTAVGAALMASLPAGAAIGALFVSRLGPLEQVRSIVPLAVGCCLPLLATCVHPPWGVALALWFLSGLCQGFMIPLIATVNLLTPATSRGQVNGLAAAGFNVATAATFLVAGLAADLTSPAVAVTAAGVLGLAFVGMVHHAWPRAELRRAATRVYIAG